LLQQVAAARATSSFKDYISGGRHHSRLSRLTCPGVYARCRPTLAWAPVHQRVILSPSKPQLIHVSVDLCTHASFFKLNKFHVHTSDNLWNPDFLYGTNESWRHLYIGFRLRPEPGSPVEGMVPAIMRNESWSRKDWEDMQSKCSRRGVTLVPEIDTPGHSLGITKWKPELSISDEPDNLNLVSYPIRFVVIA
jgi:hypothetical protein